MDDTKGLKEMRWSMWSTLLELGTRVCSAFIFSLILLLLLCSSLIGGRQDYLLTRSLTKQPTRGR